MGNIGTQAKIGLVGVVVLILVVAVIWDREATRREESDTDSSTQPAVTPSAPGSIPSTIPDGTQQPVVISGSFPGAFPQDPTGFPASIGATPTSFGANGFPTTLGPVGGVSSGTIPATFTPGMLPGLTTEAAATESAQQTYKVQANDSYWTIAKKFYKDGGLWEVIYKANKETFPNANALPVGREIVIPAKPVKEGSRKDGPGSSAGSDSSDVLPAGSHTHRVEEGESLYSIAVKYYGKGALWPRIYEANRDVLPNANALKAGQKLVVPPGGESKKR